MKTSVNMLDIARICYEANREYCAALGDFSQPAWIDAPEWQKLTVVDGVRYHLQHPFAGPADSHDNWLKVKLAEGWKYGPAKNPETKEHPCCVPFLDLPLEQQAKDRLFTAVVRALAPLCAET